MLFCFQKFGLNSIQIILILIVFLSTIGCNKLQIAHENEFTSKPPKTAQLLSSEWLPIISTLGMWKFVESNKSLYVISEDGLGILTQDDKIEKLSSFSKTSQVFMAGFENLHEEDMGTKQNLCSPENAVIVEDKLFVYAICDHSSQIWSVSLKEREKSLNLFHFTYKDENPNLDVWGPTGVSNDEDNILFPAILESGPAILDKDFKVWWRGNKTDGEIVSMDFLGSKGWMINSKGEITTSLDSGKSWKNLTNIPQPFVGKVIKIKFSDAMNGLIIGMGFQLFSDDGGLTWKSSDYKSDATFYGITANEKCWVIWDGDGNMLLNKRNNHQWHKVLLPPGKISDAIIFNNKLYALVSGKLYVSDFSKEIFSN